MKLRSRPRWYAALVCAEVLGGAVLGTPRVASAQNDPFGNGLGGGGLGMPSGPPQAPAKQAPKEKLPPGTPELHAASGGGESTLPQGSEPTLPTDPLALDDSLSDRIGSDAAIDEVDVGRGTWNDRDFYGLYYRERSSDYQLQLAFPLWFERTQPSADDETVTDRASLYGSIYYNRRSATRADDVVFPLFWNLREPDRRTTIVGPFVNRVAPLETDDWLAPLYFFGQREHGGYKIIPPLLTYLDRDEEGGFNLVGPGFCSWSGGAACFGETESQDFGIAPLYFSGHDETSKYRVIPPLLHYSGQDDRAGSELDIWGPYYREHNEQRDLFHLMPFYWSIWGAHERHTTVFPFFHYGWHKTEELLVTPLWLSSTGEDGAKTFATWGYARYRGRTELDMYSPLVWLYRDPDAGIDQKLAFPFYYQYESPRESSLALFPLYGNFERFGISDSTWITPFFNHTTSLTGWSTALHPLVYFGRDRRESHAVLAPIFYDFASPKERSTVVFPFFWRFAEPDSLTQLVGNVLYTENTAGKRDDWAFRLLPAFGFGETRYGHWWNLLFGLVGYERDGRNAKAKVFWVPITLSGDDD